MGSILKSNDFAGVIHFADSNLSAKVEPFEYVITTIFRVLSYFFEEMERVGLRNIVFSSSATVYSADNTLPLTEASNLERQIRMEHPSLLLNMYEGFVCCKKLECIRTSVF